MQPASPMDNIDFSLDEALQRFREACVLKRVEKFYQDALLAVIDDLPEGTQAEILDDETEAIGQLRSNYHLIVDSVDERSGLVHELSYLLEDFANRRGLSLYELEDCLNRLAAIRECTVMLVEQLTQWRQRLIDFTKEANKNTKVRHEEPFCDFTYRGRSVIEGLLTDTNFVSQSVLELYMNFERAGDPFFINCSSKYPIKANPPPIRTFMRISKQDMMRLYQANSLLHELIQIRKRKKRHPQPQPVQQIALTKKKSTSEYISEQTTKLLARRMPIQKQQEDAISLNLSYLRQQPKPKVLTKAVAVSVSTLEMRSIAVNTSHTLYREKDEETQTTPVRQKSFVSVDAQTDVLVVPRKPPSLLLEGSRLPRINRIQFNPQKEFYSIDHTHSKRYSESLRTIPSQVVYMEGRAINLHAPQQSANKLRASDVQNRSRKPSHLRHPQPSQQPAPLQQPAPVAKSTLPPSLETTTVPALSRPMQSAVSSKMQFPKENYSVYPASIRSLPTGHDVVPLSLSMKGLEEYIRELAQSSLKPASYDNLKQILFGDNRILSHVYLHELRKGGKLIALAVLHPQTSSNERYMYLLAFRPINLSEADIPALLDSYLNYVWTDDPCQKLCYVQHISDISSTISNFLTKLGYEEEPNKLTWKVLKPICLAVERKIPCKFEQAEQSTLAFELSEVLVDYTVSGICEKVEIPAPDQYNCFEEVVCSELVRSTVQQDRMQLTKDKKDAIKHLSIKPAELVKGKIAVHPSTKQLNGYLEDVVLDPFDSFDGLGKIHLSVSRLYDSFGFEYTVEDGSMYLKTDGLTSIYGRTRDSQYLLLKIPRSNMDYYIAIVDDTGISNNIEDTVSEPLKLRTKRFLEQTLNSDQYQRQIADKTLVRLRLFRKHLYGRLTDVDERFSIFMRLRFNLTWTDYLEGAKRCDLKAPMRQFTRPFFVAVLVKEAQTYRTLVSTSIKQQDFVPAKKAE